MLFATIIALLSVLTLAMLGGLTTRGRSKHRKSRKERSCDA